MNCMSIAFLRRLPELGAAVLAAVSCDLGSAYVPEVKADITAFEVEGQTSCRVNINDRTVAVVLNEDADISDLTVKTFRYTDLARCSSGELHAGGKIDLSSPYTLTLTTFRDYEWTIKASQPIEMYVKAENQAGEASIFADSKKIFLRVDTGDNEYDDNRRRLKILDMKLGRKGSKVVSTTDSNGNVRSIESFPVVLDCFYERKFTVEELGVKTEWSMIALPNDNLF